MSSSVAPVNINLIQQLNSTNSSLASKNTSAAGASAGTNSNSVTSTSSIQNSFMTLLITQLQNQDPLNPMDSSQMTSQLAQINTVNGINSLNTALQALNTSLTTSQSMSTASSLIGHTVLVPGSDVTYQAGTSTTTGVQLPSAADKLTLKIEDSAGNVVRTFNMVNQKAGVIPVTWDGKSDSGAAMASGTYKVVAQATQGSNNVAATTLSPGVVGSVTMGSQGALLDLGTLGNVSLSSVAMIQ